MISALAPLADRTDEDLRVAPQDPVLFPIADKILAGHRLTSADALALFASPDLLAIGRFLRRAMRAGGSGSW